MKWQVKGTRVLLEHPRLRVVEDDLILPSGEDISWLRYEKQQDFVVVLALKDKSILLIRHYNHPLEDYLYEFPCGVIDENESILAAAKRELFEETGVRAEKLERIGQFVANPRRSALRGNVVVARELTQYGAELELGEQIEPVWFPIAEFEAALSQGLEMSADALAAWALYRNSLQTTFD